MSSKAPIDAIVLAAGRSLRMGMQKLLLPFAGQTLIGHVADQVLAAPIRHTLVVVAENDDRVPCALLNKPITIVKNRDRSGEMLSSVRAGLGAFERDASAVLIVLGDQPSIRTAMVRKIVEAFHAANRGIVAPVHNGKRGHPLLVSACHFEEILTRHDDVGLRGLLAAYPEDIYDLVTPDAGVLSDVDYPDDYRRELNLYDQQPR